MKIILFLIGFLSIIVYINFNNGGGRGNINNQTIKVIKQTKPGEIIKLIEHLDLNSGGYKIETYKIKDTKEYGLVKFDLKGKDLKIGISYKTNIERVHELGHIVAYMLRLKYNYKQKVWEDYKIAYKLDKPITKYAKTNIDESFAEDFTFYVLYNDYFYGNRAKELKHKSTFFKHYFPDIIVSGNYKGLLKPSDFKTSKLFIASNDLNY